MGLTRGQSEPESNSNKEVHHTPQNKMQFSIVRKIPFLGGDILTLWMKYNQCFLKPINGVAKWR